MPTVTVVVLEYEEPGWTAKTLQSLDVVDYPFDVVKISRRGTGGLSKPCNKALRDIRSEYAWFVTNVSVSSDSIARMVALMEEHQDAAACHPVFYSDHPHLRPQPCNAAVPFIEWTAPFIRIGAWHNVGNLDEKMPYWGMDLDWSYRSQLAGYSLWACAETMIDHVYLRGIPNVYRVTEQRKAARAEADASTERALWDKYGPDWMKKLWPTHPALQQVKQ